MSDQWTDRLRDKLSDYEAPVPEELWAGVMSGVASTTPRVAPLWHRRVLYVVYPVAAVLLLIIGYALLSRPEVVTTVDTPDLAVGVVSLPIDEHQPRAADEGETAKICANEGKGAFEHENAGLDDQSQSTELSSDSYGIYGSEQPSAADGMSGRSTQELEATPVVTSDGDAPRDEATPTEVPNTQPSDEVVDEGTSYSGILPSRVHPSGRGERSGVDGTAAIEDIIIECNPRRGDAGRLSMSLFSTNLPSPTSTVHQGFGNHFPAAVQSLASGEVGLLKSMRDDIHMLNSYQETKVVTRSSVPIKLGFRFSYNITDRLIIESGISATRLATKVTSGTLKYRTETEYRMFLIGIPLNFKYDLWKSPQWAFYGSLGGALETRISKRALTEYKLDAVVIHDPDISEDANKSRILWSLRAAAGIRYSIGKRWSLFFEPGFSYYLSPNLLQQTTQITSPWIPSLTMGVNLSY